MAGVGAVKEGARAAGWRDLLRRDMGPIELAAYVGMVCAAWLGIILIAQRVDASHYGGPLEAALELFGRGLILVAALHLGLVAQWWKGLKNDARIGRLEESIQTLEESIQTLGASVQTLGASVQTLEDGRKLDQEAVRNLEARVGALESADRRNIA